MASPAFDAALSDPELLANMINVFSTINFHNKEARDNDYYSHRTRRTQKHLTLLDGLALLLVFKSTREVAATTMLQTPNRITIFWAKNDADATTQDQHDYINSLVRIFQQRRPVEDILDLVVKACREKVVERCEKAAQGFRFEIASGKRNMLDIKPDDRLYTFLESKLRDMELIRPTTTLPDALDWFLRTLTTVSKKSNSAASTLVAMITFAHALTGPGPTINSLVSEFAYRRLSKLAEYRLVCRTGNAESEKLTDKLRESLTAQEIRGPDAKQLPVQRTTVDGLNLWAQVYPENREVTDFAQIKSHFPKAENGVKGPGNKVLIYSTQHAELTVALHQLGRRTGTIDVGCSKASCYWCYNYLHVLNAILETETNPRTLVVARATHGKNTNGWLLPTDPPVAPTLGSEFLRWFGSEVQSVFDRINYAPIRTADSRSLSPGALVLQDMDKAGRYKHYI